ncbi:Multidrug resistance-like ATP-binding protein MdlB [Trichinella spiralis]|uniref:Multidrug resistance-like ATP-binding protein MdlB n=1 Tax=Trichinella spiralis TaxID=6334 RepID=A0ABR3KUR2_TRISP
MWTGGCFLALTTIPLCMVAWEQSRLVCATSVLFISNNSPPAIGLLKNRMAHPTMIACFTTLLALLLLLHYPLTAGQHCTGQRSVKMLVTVVLRRGRDRLKLACNQSAL